MEAGQGGRGGGYRPDGEEGELVVDGDVKQGAEVCVEDVSCEEK
jgi:hypothetical protein